MKWLVVLDPLEGLISKTDTSLALIRQARSNDISVDTATIENLFFEDRAAVVAADDLGRERVKALDDYSLILMRKEPPYDLAFHYATQLLSLTSTPVVNSPDALRNFNEKLIALKFHEFMPPTLVSSDLDILLQFIAVHERCVIKSLDSFQGKSVQQVGRADEEIIRSITADGKKPAMVQQFLDRVYEGDKRVFMLGERCIGAAMRRPKKGFHANFANSDALKTELTPKEHEIIETLGPWFIEHGIHFVGLDIIGEHLTEINITCPTGIVQISDLDGRNLAQETVEYFVNLVQQRP